MVRVTDDERRLVARRLRMSDERDAAGLDCLLAEVVRGREFCETPCEHCHGRLLGELADLIDPDCEEGRYSVARTARPVDRDALLALAGCVRKMGEGYDKSSSFGLGTTFRAIADRIREALGASDG